jgi:hypothetical protein
MRTDVYQRITDQIVSELEKGVRPWFKAWNAEHAAGRITRPLRGNGILIPAHARVICRVVARMTIHNHAVL